jgi:hypothetical protein
MKRTYLGREEAEDLIGRITNLEFVEDDETEYRQLELLKRGLGCEHITDLIFFADPELSPSEIVDKALARQPFVAGASGITPGSDGH